MEGFKFLLYGLHAAEVSLKLAKQPLPTIANVCYFDRLVDPVSELLSLARSLQVLVEILVKL